MDKEKLLKLITLYESVLYGDKSSMGIFQCYDTYYAGSWDEQLGEIETLKQELELVKD